MPASCALQKCSMGGKKEEGIICCKAPGCMVNVIEQGRVVQRRKKHTMEGVVVSCTGVCSLGKLTPKGCCIWVDLCISMMGNMLCYLCEWQVKGMGCKVVL